MPRQQLKFAKVLVLCFCTAVAGCAQGFGPKHLAPVGTAPEKSLANAASSLAAGGGNHQSSVIQAGYVQAGYGENDPAGSSMPTRQTSPGTTELPSPPEEIPVPRGLPEAAAPAASVPTYSDRPSPSGGGEKLITLHVDDLDVRKALEIISRQTGTSILVSPGVSGAVTLDLRDKTADEVLNAIARLCRLSIQRADDIVFVTAESEVPEGLDGKLPVRVYHLNYMRSTDVESMVKPLLSPRGTISCSPDSDVGIKSDADKAGGNAMAGGDIVIVQDYENVLKAIDRVIAQIDVQPTQVLIEAVIISVKLNKGMEMGVNFALLDDAQNTLGVVGSGMALNAAAGFNPASVIGNLKSESDNLLSSTLESKTTSGTAPTEIKNTLTNKMETSSSGLMRSGYATNDRGVKFGWTGNNTTGFLKALETMGDTKVLACPRLLVVNKQRAEIQLGDRLGYKTLTQTQTSTTEKVEFMDTGTLLRLRPFISSDGMIRMEIHPERSSGFLDINDVPQTNTAQVTTNVVVPDGATIVIGGLMDNEVQVEYQGLPFLSRLPWIGSLFRDTVTKRQKKELIVILTPHIWRPETPERLNHIGPPRALGLESRVSTLPKATGDDPPELFAIPPGARPSDITPPPKTGIGQAKPKRQTPSDFYALPRPAPAQGPEAEGEVIISDAPFPESVRP